MGETISKHIFMLPIKWDIDTDGNRLGIFEKEIKRVKEFGYGWEKKISLILKKIL